MNYKLEVWRHHHQRFGLAGEGHADVIEQYLSKMRGVATIVGPGPDGRKINALGVLTNRLVAVELSAEVLNAARSTVPIEEVRYVQADAYFLPLGSRSCDYIIALGLFAHIKEPRNVFVEFFRILRPGGHVFITNGTNHPLAQYVADAEFAGLQLVNQSDSYCPDTFAGTGKRCLQIFRRPVAAA